MYISTFYRTYIAIYCPHNKARRTKAMKKNHTKKNPNLYIYRHYRRPYPNAADPAYFIDKLVDGLLSVATCMGSITIFFFLATM